MIVLAHDLTRAIGKAGNRRGGQLATRVHGGADNGHVGLVQGEHVEEHGRHAARSPLSCQSGHGAMKRIHRPLALPAPATGPAPAAGM